MLLNGNVTTIVTHAECVGHSSKFVGTGKWILEQIKFAAKWVCPPSPARLRFDSLSHNEMEMSWHQKSDVGDFPSGTVVKNPPANAGDMGSSPGPGRSHMPRSNQVRAPQLLSPWA